ncbi:hypothetical protein BJY04DRAFT_211732 [Aspergillus karnatakaensis]|uniref:uncharacterized protein n=1 Tax=Aspergillus karnatakaensis TaxID=1810916 RepID=UPI003CCCA156
MVNETRTCFFPSGAVATNNVACSSDEYTSCCGTHDLCLSNGLCLAVVHQPYVLSRGACTDPEWGPGCPQYCRDNNPAGGCSIINLIFNQGVSTYCCGTPIATDDLTVICPENGSAFEVPTAHALVGYAMLSNVSTLDAVNRTQTSSCPDNSTITATNTTATRDADSTCCTTNGTCHSTAIGVGLGVPLGVIALASLTWAFFERKRAWGATAGLLGAPSEPTGKHAKGSGQPPAIELSGRPPYVGELDASNPLELSSR